MRRGGVATEALSRGTAARIARDFPPTVVLELTKIETSLGGRGELVGMLALAPLTPDLRYVLGLLGDPLNTSTSLAEICAIGNVLPGQLLKELASAALLKGKVLASQEIGNGIAAVAKDVMQRAAPYSGRCDGPCQGTGYVTQDPTPQDPNPSPVACPVCKGEGQLTFAPDLERQKLAVEMAQLLPKGGGINIAQINAQGAAAGAATGDQGALSRLQRLTDEILYGQMPAALEVEVEEVPPPVADTPQPGEGLG